MGGATLELSSCRCSAVSSDFICTTKQTIAYCCTDKSYDVASCTSSRRRRMTERETSAAKITK